MGSFEQKEIMGKVNQSLMRLINYLGGWPRKDGGRGVQENNTSLNVLLYNPHFWKHVSILYKTTSEQIKKRNIINMDANTEYKKKKKAKFQINNSIMLKAMMTQPQETFDWHLDFMASDWGRNTVNKYSS